MEDTSRLVGLGLEQGVWKPRAGTVSAKKIWRTSEGLEASAVAARSAATNVPAKDKTEQDP